MKDPRSIDGKIVQRYVSQRRKKCSTCRYEERLGPIYICGYMDMTEERRGCPPGDGCKRYERVQVQRKPPRPPQPMVRREMLDADKDAQEQKGSSHFDDTIRRESDKN